MANTFVSMGQMEPTGHLKGVAPARDTGIDSNHEDTSHESRLRAFHKWPHGNIWKHQGQKKKSQRWELFQTNGGERHMLAEGSSGSEPHPEPLGTKDATGTTGET